LFSAPVVLVLATSAGVEEQKRRLQSANFALINDLLGHLALTIPH
jgi:hypothetical protein